MPAIEQEQAPRDVAAEELAAHVTGVRWSVPDGDFAVLDALTDDGEEVVIVGPLAHVHEGESITVGGGWRRHARHGWQFQAARYLAAGATFLNGTPSHESDWYWRSATDLPPASRNRQVPAGEAAYQKLLAGRPAELTLSPIRGLYSELADHLEPPLAPNRAIA